MSEEFRVGTDRLLCDDWHAHDRVVVLRPRDPTTPPRVTAVRQILDVLGARGVTRVVTAALDPTALAPFLDAGFEVHEQLCVLRHPLDDTARPPRTCGVRRASPRRDLATAARIDRAAFGTPGALDAPGLRTVIAATPLTRFRLAGPEGGSAVAYTVGGLAGGCGYVQRLAVEPGHRRGGLGRRLVTDSLRWFHRHGATAAYVNTQVDNDAARNLYRRTGFVPTDRHLAVLSWEPSDR